MSVDLIIPFHGRIDLLFRCLRPLCKPPIREHLHLLLVNDGSPVRDLTLLQRMIAPLPFIEILHLKEKTGFVNAINAGWSQCRGETTIILNNDCIPSSSLVANLLAVLQREEKVAAVAPASTHPKDLFQFRERPLSRASKELGLKYSYTDYLTAMCMAIRRSAVRETFLFDPAYAPGYFEDLDLSCRLRRQGWQLAILESEHIHHEGAATFSREQHLDKILLGNYSKFSTRWGALPGHRQLHQLLGL